MARVFDVLFRFQSLVNPRLAERYTIYMRVLDEPRIITYQRNAVTGLLGTVVAMAGGHEDVFIDARPAERAASASPVRLETKVQPSCKIEAGGAPQDTVSCLVKAVKNGDRETWQSLFAGWRFTDMGEGDSPDATIPTTGSGQRSIESAWNHSRRMITTEVYDARVNRVSPIEVLHQPGEDSSIPKVEQATVILEHVGRIDDEYRTFTNLNVRRVWKLQRVDDGPWKIAYVQRL